MHYEYDVKVTSASCAMAKAYALREIFAICVNRVTGLGHKVEE